MTAPAAHAGTEVPANLLIGSDDRFVDSRLGAAHGPELPFPGIVRLLESAAMIPLHSFRTSSDYSPHPVGDDYGRLLFVCAHPALPLAAADRAIWRGAEELDFVSTRDLYSSPGRPLFAQHAERAELRHASEIVVHYPVLHRSEPAQLSRWLDESLPAALPYGAETHRVGFRITTVVNHGSRGFGPANRRWYWDVEERLAPLRRRVRRIGLVWHRPVAVRVALQADDHDLRDLRRWARSLLSAWTGPSARTTPIQEVCS